MRQPGVCRIKLKRFDPRALEEIRSYSPNGDLIALPFEYQPFVLYYNKDIFDKFGVSYPKLGSTWDDLIPLARKLTRMEDGIQYKGLNPGSNINRMQMQLSNPYVNPKTYKSLIISTPGWKKQFQTYLDIYSIPGNTPGDATSEFLERKVLAMFPHLVKGLSQTAWETAVIYIPKSSKYPDFAFQVTEYLLSDEIQTLAVKDGRATALLNPQVQKVLMQDNTLAKEAGFDISMVTRIQLAGPYQRTEWDKKAASSSIKRSTT
jgi:multiple sugar transport system substrate-binding protein